MTEQEQRIAIAEACGWKLVDDNTTGRNPARSFDHYSTHGNEPIPDYLRDLNAMHFAVASQSYEFRLAFDQELRATANTLGCLVCELKAADWAACFLTIKRAGLKLNA